MTTATGKLFVIGEYAALYGGGAVLVPVPHQAFVRIIEDDRNQLTIRNETTRTFSLSEAVTTQPLLSAVVETLDCEEELNSISLSLDTSAFFYKGRKLGLGSSAALTAALVKALRPGLPQSSQLTLAISAHQLFQSGHGSGADVALALMGAPVFFRRDYPAANHIFPADLHMLAIWSGEPASTPNYINKVEAWRSNNPDRFEYHIERLCKCTEDFLLAENTTSQLNKIHLYGRYLYDFSEDSNIKFYNAPHITLQKEVESAGCIYKPSGAGGGDFGIAFSEDEDILSSLTKSIHQEGRLAFRIR